MSSGDYCVLNLDHLILILVNVESQQRSAAKRHYYRFPEPSTERRLPSILEVFAVFRKQFKR
ncbi:hypothetical protein J6590_016811 [Homalodisca vitripennis]|nr:hypothetical protein J6590_016811 [Homalodisca vitripennis]